MNSGRWGARRPGCATAVFDLARHRDHCLVKCVQGDSAPQRLGRRAFHDRRCCSITYVASRPPGCRVRRCCAHCAQRLRSFRHCSNLALFVIGRHGGLYPRAPTICAHVADDKGAGEGTGDGTAAKLDITGAVFRENAGLAGPDRRLGGRAVVSPGSGPQPDLVRNLAAKWAVLGWLWAKK